MQRIITLPCRYSFCIEMLRNLVHIVTINPRGHVHLRSFSYKRGAVFVSICISILGLHRQNISPFYNSWYNSTQSIKRIVYCSVHHVASHQQLLIIILCWITVGWIFDSIIVSRYFYILSQISRYNQVGYQLQQHKHAMGNWLVHHTIFQFRK